MMWPTPSPISASVSRLAYTTLRITRLAAWSLLFSLVSIAALADLLTGSAIWFGPVYLFILCIATWLLGWLIGHSAGIFCMLLTFIINGATLYPYGTSVLSFDFALRFAAMSIVLSAIAAARGAYIREWWLARIEPMTGALNRQAFFEFGDVSYCARDWRVLLFADLDGFKAINDSSGHAAGDECLRRFARAVRLSIGRDDIFARMGGDEFVLLKAVKDEASASFVATRLHAVMNTVPCSIEGGIRCSVGALLVPPGDISLDDMIRQADALMYKAKAKGGALYIGQAKFGAAPRSCGGARRTPRPTILFDSLTPNIHYERSASH